MSAHHPSPAALRAADKLCQCGLLFEGDSGLAAGVIDAELAPVAAMRERARELHEALSDLLMAEKLNDDDPLRFDARERSAAALAKIRAEREGGK